VEPGDYLLIENPVFKTKEERKVTLILSSKSILLDEPFHEEFYTYISYQIRKKEKIIPG
jgi:hypothetical protein